MNLRETQALFWRALQGEEIDARTFIQSTGNLPAEERLAIYIDMYVARLAGILEGDFPETRAALGHERFHALALDYLKATPSTDPDIGRAGRGFAAFCPPEVRALAELEWARTEALVAEECAPITPDEFAALIDPRSFGKSFLSLLPSLRLAGNTAVWRNVEYALHEVTLDSEEARALALALQGAVLDDVCAAFEKPEAAFAALQSWVAEGWVCSLSAQ